MSLERNEGIVKAKTQETELEAKLVLGADGFTSTVAKSFGLEKTGNREVIPCIQYLMVNCTFRDEQTAEFYLGREVAPLGYAWAFPKGEGKANVGIGVRGSPAKPYLEKFIEGNPDMFSKAKVIGIEGAPVTIGGMLDQIVDDNVMLVGEAAGQVVPLTGAGIHSGVVGAKMAAQTAIDALEKGDFSKDMLMSYSENYSEHWGKRISDSLKALRMIEQLNDDEMNMLAEMLDSSDILDLANGLDIGRVARRFLRHPIFGLKVARMLAKS